MRNQYRGFTTVNLSRPGQRRVFVLLILGTALIFSIAGAFAMFQAKNSMQTSDLSKVTSHLSDKTLVMLIGGEVPYLQEHVQAYGIEKMVSRLIFEMATSIDFRDPRTFLGRELPLFALFDTEIDVASSDVDYTSIPIESPPPPELEKEILKGMQGSESSNDEESLPDAELRQGANTKHVLIYNTHFWESYLPELGETNPGKASDVDKNVTQISKYMAKQLEKMGVGAMTVQRKYTWNSSYAKSRKMVQSVMKQNDDLQYLIDIHRDSLPRNKTTIKGKDGKTYARLAFVVGGSSKNYEKNLKLARYLHNRVNQIFPGLSRAVVIKKRTNGNNGEYNQSLSPNSTLVEVGGVGNNFEEAYRSVDILAKVLTERVLDATPVMGQPQKP
ncbi:stage II sporulation protein P [Paenactinomyces guangxiensis]|uniref:Stage II sporulation protein P n=1 Tax=Paenactinomyces guangxiensis TaxID=1490290 RepID=A0A7W1WNF0_9BACL|nr:stage II sporulation protein P [Paenactinomyces guangxiensis]MBA4493120.1 stage II sporulation protein P [Paenactinomyces guangxiensis]MBH8590030.1 stage II sporulation protein P [Paenactinomyces guangxiensis]